MPFTFDNIQGGRGSLDITGTNSGSYLDTVDPTKLLDDPRFLADMREYYRIKGQSFDNDQEMLNQWYDDRTYAELNMTIGTVSDMMDTRNADARERELKKRMVRGYQLMPFFWQEGGFGERDSSRVAKSIGKAIATDPINLVGPARALPAAGAAYRAATVAGRSGARAAMARGGAVGAGTEAAIAAPITAAADIGIQQRDVELGLQNEIDLGRVGMAGATGGVLGGGIGGTLGAATGLVGGRAAAKKLQLDELANMYQQRPGEFAIPIEEVRTQFTDDIARNQNIMRGLEIDADERAMMAAEAAPEQAAEQPLRPGLRAEDVDMDAAAINLRAAQEELQRGYRDKIDPDTLEGLERDAKEARSIYSLAERIKREEFEIEELINSNDEGKKTTGLNRWRSLQETIGVYRRLVDQAESPEGVPDEDIVRVGEILGPEEGQRQPQQLALEQQDQGVPLLEDQATRRTPGEGDVVEVDTEGQAQVRREGEAAAEPAPPTRTVKNLEDIYFDEVFKVEETGEVIPAKKSAAKAYQRITSRIDNLYALRKCLGI